MRVEVVPGLSDVDAAEWDALAGDDNPFVEHRFLLALEKSHSVGEGTGWLPAHVLVREDDGRPLIGAAPAYIKSDSYGEYIFDWGWADAAMRAGVSYYPKIVSAVPFTPATGPRLMVAPGADPATTTAAILGGMRALANEVDASSVHVLFLEETERDQATAEEDYGFMPRLTYQYHWENAGYANFDEFLGALRAPSRKQIRRERRQARDSGLTLRTLRGPELEPHEWSALWTFYRRTTGRKHAIPYLTHDFFELLRHDLAERVVVTLASDGKRPVAAALAFHKGAQIFGRYWGCEARVDGLHFELCYYRLIELAIELGCRRFEAGAQGQHKIKRGLMPNGTHSLHWLRHPGLERAVAEYLPREAEGSNWEMEQLAEHGPFRRGE